MGPALQAVPVQIALEQKAAGDLDAHCAGGAVVAAAAELGAQRVPHLLAGGLLLRGEGGGGIAARHIGLQLFGVRHAGNGHRHIGVGEHIPQRKTAVLDGAAGQRLHVNKALTRRGAPVNQLSALLLHNIVGEHDGLDLLYGKGTLKHGGQMRRDADMSHHPGGFGLQQRLHGAAGGKDGLQPCQAGVVELVQLNMIGAQVFQALRQFGFHLLFGQGAAFGGKDKPVPQAQLLQRLSDPFLADGVGAGGVDVIDARLAGGLEHGAGARLVDALDGNAPKSQARNPKAGTAQFTIFHDSSPLFCCLSFYYISSAPQCHGKCRRFLLTLRPRCDRIMLIPKTNHDRRGRISCVTDSSGAAIWVPPLPVPCAGAPGRKM